MLKLRPYQLTTKAMIKQHFDNGIKSVFMVMPTGGGKTVTFADMVAEVIKNGFNPWIVVDRKELLEQAKGKVMQYGITPGIVTGGKRFKPGKEAYIATVQTLIKLVENGMQLDNLFVVIDEAHEQIFDKLILHPSFKDAHFILATATPIRTGKARQLHELGHAIVEATTVRELIREGYLVPAITYGPRMEVAPTMKVTKGDYDETELFKSFDKPQLYKGVVDEYVRFAKGTKAICFCINREHSRNTAQAFNDAGISARHVDANSKDRDEIFKAHKAGLFDVLCNVGIATKGYDDWTIETVIVNLATLSLSKWLQMAGRGARPTDDKYIDVPGYLQKSHFNLLDMGGNTYRLGFWEQTRKWSLTHKTKTKLDVAPVKECESCSALVPSSARKCGFCGFEFPVKERSESEADFLPIEYTADSLPEDLIGKAWGDLPIKDLERVRIARGYKLGWIVRNIMLRNPELLLDYAILRNFKNPEGWVEATIARVTTPEAAS